MAKFLECPYGLQIRHQQENPVFEKTYLPPHGGSKLVSRIYADGSLYYLSRPNTPEDSEIMGQRWIYISSVTEKGLQLIKDVLVKGCEITDEISHSGNSMGVVIWKTQCKNGIREIVIPGIPSGKFRIFLEIDEAINANIIKINELQ